MSVEPGTREELLFVVRLWLEPGGAVSRRWRGYIEHVATKKRLYFSQVAELNDFIRLHQENTS